MQGKVLPYFSNDLLLHSTQENVFPKSFVSHINQKHSSRMHKDIQRFLRVEIDIRQQEREWNLSKAQELRFQALQ